MKHKELWGIIPLTDRTLPDSVIGTKLFAGPVPALLSFARKLVARSDDPEPIYERGILAWYDEYTANTLYIIDKTFECREEALTDLDS